MSQAASRMQTRAEGPLVRMADSISLMGVLLADG